MGTPWYDYPITQGYGGAEWGNDIGTPYETPLTMPYGGVVVESDYKPWGGVVAVRTSIPGIGNNLIEYIQHMDLIANGITVGQTLTNGQFIGYSGGQTSGGHHPTDPAYSSGPHTEYGFGANWINGAAGCVQGDPTCNPNSIGALQNAIGGKIPPGGTGGGPPPPPSNGCSFTNLGGCIAAWEQSLSTIQTPPCNFLNMSGCTQVWFPWLSGIQTFFSTLQVNALDYAIRGALILIGIILIINALKAIFASAGVTVNMPTLPQQQQQQQQQSQPVKNTNQTAPPPPSESEAGAGSDVAEAVA